MQHSELTKKFQTSHSHGRHKYPGPGDSLHLMDKVDVDSPCLMLREKCIYDSLNNRANDFRKNILPVAANNSVDYRILL
jgi:ethanolamine utilization protein EutP (predicted NTPase)